MFNRKLFFVLFLVLIVACNPESTKIYEVNYKGNHPVGTFLASIGNNIIFTNGPEILEVHVKKNPDFFCYAVNKEVLCDFTIDVKVSEASTKRFKEIVKNLRVVTIKLEKNMTILSKRFNYYLNDKKLESEGLIIDRDLQNKNIDTFSIPIKGKGKTEEDAKDEALISSIQVINVLIDKSNS